MYQAHSCVRVNRAREPGAEVSTHLCSGWRWSRCGRCCYGRRCPAGCCAARSWPCGWAESAAPPSGSPRPLAVPLPCAPWCARNGFGCGTPYPGGRSGKTYLRSSWGTTPFMVIRCPCIFTYCIPLYFWLLLHVHHNDIIMVT